MQFFPSSQPGTFWQIREMQLCNCNDLSLTENKFYYTAEPKGKYHNV